MKSYCLIFVPSSFVLQINKTICAYTLCSFTHKWAFGGTIFHLYVSFMFPLSCAGMYSVLACGLFAGIAELLDNAVDEVIF